MIKPYFQGASGSNAGDKFHELWALRQSLLLLEQNTSLTEITVEGLKSEDETGESSTWDGVDCTYYFGGDNASSADQVIIEQLKYSASNPGKNWTISRLTYSEAKTKDNSIIRKLADAFSELSNNHSELVENGNLVIRFVSNQPIDSVIIDTFSEAKSVKKTLKNKTAELIKLIKSSGLKIVDFISFAKCLDFSHSGSESRFAIEERVLTTISEWTEDDARTSVNNLLSFIQKKMLPESKGEPITRQSILAQLGFSDPRALFPCPRAIKKINNLIPRNVTQDIAELMSGGEKHLCLHGEGGCGKTTTLQELKKKLPQNSAFIVFDCYGEGSYLDADAYRHRSKDAFLQLSNELAQNLRTPLLISPSIDVDYPRVFAKRLEKASEIVLAIDKKALLVITIDAADNSITAAKTRPIKEVSFVHELFNLGCLPENVRFLVTARTGRLDSLELPPKFKRIEIKGFDLKETSQYVKTIWKDAPDNWIEDFHYLSRGNPRVQNYALNYAESNYSKAIEYLRPSGKGLHNIFDEQLKQARNKGGVQQDIRYFCAGLVALPRPIPIEHLSEIVELKETYLRDICADLTPGIRLINNLISFSDEDFEHFIRDESIENLSEVQNRIAEHFFSKHKSDSYAATHVATALLEANRGQKIIELVNSEKEPLAIGDPVLRRETQLHRLKIAMKVCRETGNTINAILTLLTGANALKTDSAIQEMLINNPDLAANFARDTFGRIILRDSIQIENHGVLLFHLMAFDARKNNGILVREGNRQLQAWLQRRNEEFKKQKKEHPYSSSHGWEISYRDIAAETEAILRTSGSQNAIKTLFRWKPKHIRLQVASILSNSLMASGDENLLEECLKDERITDPWKLFLLTPLAFMKRQIDLSLLEKSLEKLQKFKIISICKLQNSYREDDSYTGVLETIMTACEIVISRGGKKEVVIPILEKLCPQEYRRQDRLFKHQKAFIDLSLRAFTLLENLSGRDSVVENYLVVDDSKENKELNQEKKRQNDYRNEEKGKLQIFIGHFFRLYNTRAKIILGEIDSQSALESIEKIVSQANGQDYRLYNDHDLPAMKRLAALSLTRLMILPDLNRKSLLSFASSLTNSSPFNSSEADLFQRFVIDSSLHQHILREVTSRVEKIKTTRTSAEDKIEALVRFARLILPFSYDDAESLFNEAVTIAGEVNYDTIHEISLFAPLSKSAVRTMTIDKRRAIAADFATIASDVSIRLNGQDNFPWNKIAQTLTNLNVCVALAAIGRWEDDNIVERKSLLPKFLETALSNRTLSPTHIISFFPLLDYVDEELITWITGVINETQNESDKNHLIEEIAREELLRLGKGKREKVYDALNSSNKHSKKIFWLEQLSQATAFHKLQIPNTSTEDNSLDRTSKYETAKNDILNNFDWKQYKFVSSEEINNVVKEISDTVKSSDTYISMSAILEKIRDFVSIGNRVSYLKALCSSESKNIDKDDIAQEISKLTKLWDESPSVQNWSRQYVLQLIIDKLPGFTRYLAYGDYPPATLPNLIARAKAPDSEICETLLEATERHVDSLSAPTVYALVGLMAQYCQPEEATEIIEVYSKQLLERIPIKDRENWDLSDIPEKPLEGLARYIYALMSDVDVRNRWRTAHSLRILARLKDSIIIDELINLYDRKTEINFRKPDAPFYWIASRLWLIISIARIADETPSTVKHLAQWLLNIANDEDFPHIIVRAFAKSAISNLLKSEEILLNFEQLKVFEKINISTLPKGKSLETNKVPFQKYRYKERENRRFQFDSMDTLPYWYSGKARMFLNLDLESFIDAAESWIVDKWGVTDNPWMWEQETRKDRLSSYPLERMNRNDHGSLPVGERFDNHLEWHAMWCAIGELLQTIPLAKDDDSYDSFEERISRNGLSFPPFWLSDLRNPKPLDKRFWFDPAKDIENWIEDVKDNDFLLELSPIENSESIIIGCDYDTKSSNFSLSVRIDTALVSPGTAKSLINALQTIDNPFDYRIPSCGDELEINEHPYKLLGWLSNDYSDSGFDERDPFRNDITTIRCEPSEEVISALDLRFVFDNQPKWIQVNTHKEIFNYKSWSDVSWDDYRLGTRYDSDVRSSGWQLSIDKGSLKNYLEKKELDLIIEVRITRKNKDYEHSEYNKKKTKEVEFERIFVFRRDGSIEAAEGHFGTWETSRPRT